MINYFKLAYFKHSAKTWSLVETVAIPRSLRVVKKDKISTQLIKERMGTEETIMEERNKNGCLCTYNA